MAEALEINDMQVLAQHRLAWRALHNETPRASFFQTFEWLDAYWKHFGEGQRLRVFAVRAAGKPLGFVPLVERSERGAFGALRVLTYPLDAWGSVYGPIGQSPTATLLLAFKAVAAERRTWDVFEPRWVAADSSDHGRTERAMRMAGLPATRQASSETSIVDCEALPSWGAYLASRSAKVRHEIGRRGRQLEAAARVEVIRHRPEPWAHGDGDPRWDLYDACVSISDRSWQASSPDGNTLGTARVRAFLRDAHAAASRLGMVDMSLLTVDGEPVAFYYAYFCRGEVIGLRMGYDPAAPKGVGAVLLDRVLEDSFARGDRRVELGCRADAYKARLRTGVESTVRWTHVPTTAVRPRIVSAARWVRQCWKARLA
jgi:CelD/BcsL family acetyltransferase involved in cellulose biosynthesis